MKNKININNIFKLIKILIILLITFEFISLCFSFYKADVVYEKAKFSLDDTKLSEAFDYAEQAIKLNPLEPNYYRIRARILINYLPYKEDSLSVLTKQLVVKDLQTAYDLNPRNLVTIRNLIPLYYFVGAKDITIPANPENVDPYFIDVVRDFYARVKYYSPQDAGIYALLAKYEKRLDLTDEYDESVSRLKVLRPDLLEWYDSFK